MNRKLINANHVLLQEWDFEKNGDLHPMDFIMGSNQKVWWKCKLGHSWEEMICSRFLRRYNCPYCSNRRVWQGYNDMVTTHPNVAAQWDYEKNGDLRPENFTGVSYRKVWWKCRFGHSWKTMIRERVNGKNCPYCTGKYVWQGYNDIVTTHPDIASQWDHEKNGGLRPEQFSIGSNKKFWWKCGHGHSWQAVMYSRKFSGCAVCAGKAVMKGVNDFQTLKPHLAKEWDYEKNGNLRPDNFTCGSNRKVWWKCKLGHSWEAMIATRALDGENCPYCANKKVWQGYNDIVTTHPDIAAQWDYEKNGDLRPEQFTIGANKKFGWNCKYGHSWQAMMYSRKSHGCAVCDGKAVMKGVNDLRTVNSDLAKEWDYEKNGNLHPDNFTAGSEKKAWWLCEKGHSWEAVISSRNAGRGCPYCNSFFVLAGFNDLMTIAPELAAEWDYDRNEERRPENVMGTSNTYAWWKCKYGHSWKALIANRRKGRGCPYCAGKRAIVGETDLQTLRPDLCKEWDYEKNVLLKPNKITANSGKKAYWICPKGHGYTAKIIKRNNGSGCPVCAGRVVILGENDLKTLCPEIAAEWDYGKNPDKPENYTIGSEKRVWWLCPEGHSWKTDIYHRYNGGGCPYCMGRVPMRTRLVK